jgi:hypothetical protein
MDPDISGSRQRTGGTVSHDETSDIIASEGRIYREANEI